MTTSKPIIDWEDPQVSLAAVSAEQVILGRIEAAMRLSGSATAVKVWRDVRAAIDDEDVATERGRYPQLVDYVCDYITLARQQ